MTFKQKQLIWLTAVLAVITAALALIPSISWSVRAPRDILLGKWKAYSDGHGDGYPGGPELPKLAPNGNLEHDLVALLWKSPSESDKSIHSLVDRRLPTAFGYAVAIRSLGVIGRLDHPEPDRPVRPTTARKLERFGLIVEAAQRGAALEPENSYFPLSQAVALQGLGRTKERDQAIGRAAKCQTYNDYANEQSKLQERIGFEVHGDRGTWVRRVESFLYYSGDLRGLAAWIRLSEPDRSGAVRRDFIQAITTIYRSAPDRFILGRACINLNIEYRVYGDPPAERDARAFARARQVSPATAQALKECIVRSDYPYPEHDRFLSAADVTGLNAGVLASLIVALACLATAWIISRLPEGWGLRAIHPLFPEHLMAKRLGAAKVIWFVLIVLFGAFIAASGQELARYATTGTSPESSGIVFALLVPVAMLFLPGVQGFDFRTGGRLWLGSLRKVAIFFWSVFLVLAVVDVYENHRWAGVFEAERNDASAIRAWTAEASHRRG